VRKPTGPKPVDRAGERHGKLLVVSLARINPYRNRWWLCQCGECGKEREIATSLLGRWPNCGCVARSVQTKAAILARKASAKRKRDEKGITNNG
jgi:hypothetical protein